jgi:hypothetical protein
MKFLDFIFKTSGISFWLMFIGTYILGEPDSLMMKCAWVCGLLIGILTEKKKEG